MGEREKILSGLDDIKVLSSPVLATMHVVNNPSSTPEEIEKAVSLDPALTANVLRFANSAYFGTPHGVHSVRDAVVRLGVNMIMRMLYLSSAHEFCSHPVLGYGLPAGSLWGSMVTTAVTTEILGRQLEVKPPAYVFTAGLLHNIGKLILGSYLERDAAPICKLADEKQISFEKAEEELLGISHAEVGAELLKRWAIPDGIVNAVRWHLQPEECPEEFQTATDFVHVANAVTLLAGYGLGVDGLSYTISRSSERRLGITSKTIETTLCSLQEEAESLESLMQS